MKLFATTIPDDNVVHITLLLLQQLGVKVTDTTVRDSLLTNPHHPSLLSISDSLRTWNIDSLAIKTTAEKLYTIPRPFVAHIDFNPGTFVIVTKITDTTVNYLTDQHEELQTSLNEFVNRWDGIVLMVETKPESGEQAYHMQERKEYWKNYRILWTIVALFVIGTIQLLHFTSTTELTFTQIIYITGSFIINCAGIAVTTALLWYEYDHENPFIKKFCAVSATASCSSVLFSKGAKLFNLISWSEIGFIFFTGNFFYQLFATENFYWLALISAPAAAYILYSVLYQAFIIRQWCMLCLTVQALLLLHLSLGLLTNQITHAFAAGIAVADLTILAAYAIPAIIWILLKPYLYESRDKKVLEKQLAKIKNNKQIFEQLLQLQEPVKTIPASVGITIGDPHAPNVIIKVCSPYCEPCARSYPEVDSLLDKGNWKVQMIFTNAPLKNDRNSQAAAYLLHKVKTHSGAVRQIMSEWYAIERHNTTLPAPAEAEDNVKQHAAHLQAMYNWCLQENIRITPTIYVNGHKLPEPYALTDLHSFET